MYLVMIGSFMPRVSVSASNFVDLYRLVDIDSLVGGSGKAERFVAEISTWREAFAGPMPGLGQSTG